MPTSYSSNLTRFRPRIASKASGTPLNRHNQAVENLTKAVASRRRLPLTQVKSETQRR